MKILFIIPWGKDLYGNKSIGKPAHPHLGIGYLAANCRKNGFNEVKVFDESLEQNDNLLKKTIRDFKPDLIGITVFSYCFELFQELIDKVKIISNAPVLIGGPHISAVKKDSLKLKGIDFAMKGEVETSFIIFLKELQKNTPNFRNVPNLIWHNKKGEIIENENAPLIADLDSLPFPDYSDFKLEQYNYFQTKTMPIITSRGCPYGCNYCSVRLSMGQKFRARSPENILQEIKYWVNRGYKNFEINDDCFSLDICRAKEFCDLIIKEKLEITYQLYNGIRVDRVDKDLLQRMKNSGCVFVSFGVESGNQAIIDKIGKGIKLKQVKEAVKLTNEVGISNSANFIIGHPGETYKTAMETLGFAKNLPTNFVNVYNLIPYPGTDLYNWIEKNASWIYHPDYVLRRIGSRDLKPAFETKEFTEGERIKVLKEGFSLYEKTILRFRFGKFFGKIFYFFSKNRKLFKWGMKQALESRIGFKLYSLISSRSKNK